jgi:circadian clock protein KaiC
LTVEGIEAPVGLEKAATGIEGLDEVTHGGLPKGRPTLICGGAGSGKTMFAIEFLVRGAMLYGEPGLLMAFEETPEDLARNVASLGFDLLALQRDGLLRIDHVKINRAEIEESGEYDLEGLFIRLNHYIDQIGAKRVVLDTVETIFSGLGNQAILRNELQRLFQWLKVKGVTAVITGEQGSGQLTRQGLEEYVSDCVILLDHRVHENVSTRRLRIVKYRGSLHGTNEYPFLMDEEGISVLPVTSLGLKHEVSDERLSIGLPDLDEMLGGGPYRGSSVLMSGTSGSGKSSLACIFSHETCSRGEKVLYFASEESPGQIVRNMRSIGLDLQQWIDAGRLAIYATRPMHHGLELHLATMQRLISRLNPSVVILDPISNLNPIGTEASITAMLIRLVDFLKMRGITGLFVNLTTRSDSQEWTEAGLSSLMDTWILLRDIEMNGERNRAVYVLKSRGTNHSNQIREFHITSNGIELRPAYVGPDGVLTGSARTAQESKERRLEELAAQDADRRRLMAERRRGALEVQIAVLQVELESADLDASHAVQEESQRIETLHVGRNEMAQSRRIRKPSAHSRSRERS